MPGRRRVTALVCLSASLAVTATAFGRDRRHEVTTVQDLAYGEVLFHFFQDDYFAALMRLLAAQTRNELSDHAAEADALLGGLYLSYGHHRSAGEIFERLLAQSVAPELHDRVWFFLAKIWYQRGYSSESEAALARIGAELPAELEPERQMLRAQVLMDQGRFDEALRALEAWRKPPARWLGYAKYNIGVALVRLGRIEDGARVLDEVGQLVVDSADRDADRELAALRDKANVALGYAWLQASEPLRAKPSLERVRLNGPFSNKALLGFGWADVELANYEAALAPWIELRGRSLLDSAVQESLLAVPYAFAELGAHKQAADHYTDAIWTLSAEIDRLAAAIEAVRRGELIAELLGREADTSGWYWRLDQLPDSVEVRYLYELLATHAFQEGLKNYRDLKHLNSNLEHWLESLAAFDDILDTRERAYRARRPVVDESLGRIDLELVDAQRIELESQLAGIERSKNVVALGTANEQQLWRALSAMEAKLALLSDDPAAAELRDKQRFLKGLLSWDLEREYKARLWARRQSLRELDRELQEARRRHQQIERARDAWPETFGALGDRIAGVRPRVLDLQRAVEAALPKHEALLRDLAVAELEAQHARLNTYLVQAQFALASLYDRSAARIDAAGRDLARSAAARATAPEAGP